MRRDCGFEMEVGMTLTSSAGSTTTVSQRTDDDSGSSDAVQHASEPGNTGRRHARWPSLHGRPHGSARAVHPVQSGVAHLRGTTNGDAGLRRGGALTTLDVIVVGFGGSGA